MAAALSIKITKSASALASLIATAIAASSDLVLDSVPATLLLMFSLSYESCLPSSPRSLLPSPASSLPCELPSVLSLRASPRCHTTPAPIVSPSLSLRLNLSDPSVATTVASPS